MKALLISNPLSGHYSDRKINILISSLNKKNIIVERHNLKKEERIDEIIQRLDPDEYSELILAFGDGTINSACNALLNRSDYDKFNILIIPMGTANIISIELNCEKIKNSVKAFLNRNIKKVHIGLANKKYFVTMASAGFDSVTVKNVSEKLKSKIGKMAYIYSLFKILFKKKNKITTKVNGKKYENILTCASNGKYYGIKLKTTNSEIVNNVFDVIIIKKLNIFHMIKYLFNKRSNKSVEYIQNVEKLSINGDIPYQVDGDCVDTLPLDIKSTDKFLNFYYYKN